MNIRSIRFVLPGFVALLACHLGSLAAEVAAAEADYDTQMGVVYVKRGELELKADLYIPRGVEPRPGVLVVHGGAWTSGSRTQLAGVASRLASGGFTAVAISYRLAPQYLFPAQIEDCKAAVRWMREHAPDYKIDPTRIGGFGYSAGGHLIALLGTTDSHDGLEGEIISNSTRESDAPSIMNDPPSTRLQAYVAGGAPCDLRDWPGPRSLVYWLGATRTEKPEAYALASPIRYVTKDDPPAFFYHGTADRLVPLQNPQAMVAQLKQAGVSAELYEVKDAGHIGAFLSHDAVTAGIAFLKKRLRDEDQAARRAPVPNVSE